MPQGGRPTHPGDRAPRRGLGRAGRLTVAVTVTVGILVGLAIRTAGATDHGSVGGASPTTVSPFQGGGQRIEMTEAGFAMTFPGDWEIELIGEGSDRSIIVLVEPERFGPEVQLQRLLFAWDPVAHEREEPHLCTLHSYAPIDLTADEFLDEVFGQSASLEIDSLSEGLSRVLVNPWIDSRILDDPETIYVDHIAIGGDDLVAMLMCYGAASHRDEWLAIAESFESLPED